MLNPSSWNIGNSVRFKDISISSGSQDDGTHKAQLKFCRFNLQFSFLICVKNSNILVNYSSVVQLPLNLMKGLAREQKTASVPHVEMSPF